MFVGYGLDDARLGLTDYRGLDVRGKTVVALSGTPGGPADRNRRPSRVAKRSDGGPPWRGRLHRGFARLQSLSRGRRTGRLCPSPHGRLGRCRRQGGKHAARPGVQPSPVARTCRAAIQWLASKPRRDPPRGAKEECPPRRFRHGQPDRDQRDQQVAGLHQPRSDRHPARKRPSTCATNMSC